MRGTRLFSRQEEEEESVFVSMADMTISFLFIIMILLAFFASQFSVSDTIPRAQLEAVQTQKERMEKELQAVQEIVLTPDLDIAGSVKQMKEELDRLRQQVTPDSRNPMEVYNSAVSETRKQLLLALRDQINQQVAGVNVTVSSSFDALQFQGDGLFPSGKDIPTPNGEIRMRHIASILDKYLGCFSLGPRTSFNVTCNRSYALIDAVQIEGHTDDIDTDDVNMRLSAERAARVFSLMTKQQPGLLLYKNRGKQPVLSIAGFGKGRPIQTNETESGRDANRRIDLRLVMVVPTKTADIEAIKDALESRSK